MRVALMHDYLNQYGGGERVLEALMEIFPNAPVYTLFYDKEKTFGRFEGRVKKTSFLDWPIVRKNHRWFIPLMPVAADFLKLEKDYDLIISSSAGFGKGIGTSQGHISYIHTPLRYAWESGNYFNWHPALKLAAAPLFRYLRWWDKKAGQKPDVLIANSEYIAGKIRNYYGRDAEVLYPPVDLEKFYPDKTIRRGDYFLAVGRLLPYKRFDLVIDTFAKLGLPLKIVGTGPEEKKLRATSYALRADNIELLPFASEDQLRTLYSNAQALIFPQTEDFGLVAAEAQACGCPVIAFSEGGAKEIVQDSVTGLFFHWQTAGDLAEAVKKFQTMSFDRKIIEKSAERFSKEKFKNKILELAKSSQLS